MTIFTLIHFLMLKNKSLFKNCAVVMNGKRVKTKTLRKRKKTFSYPFRVYF